MGAGTRPYDSRLVSAAGWFPPKTKLQCGSILLVPCLAFIATAQPAANWTRQLLPAVPAARGGHALAYDSGRGQVLLFGGGLSTVDFNDTWVWNGTTWVEIFPAVQPPKRANHAMAYDAAHGRVVLFGGKGDMSTRLAPRNDTWVWDGANWTQVFPATSPPPRSNFAMVYDAVHSQVVLFGGTQPSTFYNDTWVWNGSNWVRQFPSVSPPARYGHAMVYDAALGEVVLFGGFVSGVGDANDMWLWNGVTWTQKVEDISPPARDGHAMAYDEVHDKVVLFGGSTNEDFNSVNDTWLWDGTSWTQTFPATPPPARYDHAVAYDAASGETLLFGGFSKTSGTYLNDTWTWNGGEVVPQITAVVNAASFQTGGVVPGEIAAVFGKNLTFLTGINTTSAVPLPTELLNVSVTVNNPAAPIFAVDNVNGQQQINFQVPWELASETSAHIAVTNSGAISPSVVVPVLAAQPGIFSYSSGGETFGAILHANFQLADAGHPAKPGETVLIYCTGLGAVSSAPADGEPGKGQATLTTPAVVIGGTNAVVTFSGLAPGLVGLYQLNVEIPAGLSEGMQPVMVSVGGASSNIVLLPVE